MGITCKLLLILECWLTKFQNLVKTTREKSQSLVKNNYRKKKVKILLKTKQKKLEIQ